MGSAGSTVAGRNFLFANLECPPAPIWRSSYASGCYDTIIAIGPRKICGEIMR
jgi:hypothetical protein